MASTTVEIPQWKKDLIARLKQSGKNNEERYWFDQHPPKQSRVSDLIIPTNENGYKTDRKHSNESNSSEEDLHYGPGIVNKLKNKYLSLALREASFRPTILRKATSLENLLDEDERSEDKREGGRLFRSRGGEAGPGSHLNRYTRQTNRQEMKRARSVEAISRRLTSDSSLSPTSLVPPNINHRQSLHEDMLLGTAIMGTVEIPDNESTKNAYKKMATATENGGVDVESKYTTRINRPKRIQPLLNEKEKPPLDVVSKAKMIFEKRPETRTKKPPQTGDVAAKVEGFNSIIVKSKVANSSVCKKPPIKHTKPVLTDKQKNTRHRPVAKPIILNPDEVKVVAKPRTLELGNNHHDIEHKRSKWELNMPSPIPDVSRVNHKNAENNHTNSNNLCETPDLILTSSPVQMLHSPTFKRNTTEKFLRQERNLGVEATNRFISPLPSPTKSPTHQKSPQLNVTYTKEKFSPLETPKSGKYGRSSPTKTSRSPTSPVGRISPSLKTNRSPVRSPTLVSPRETFGSVTDDRSFSPSCEEPLSPGMKVISPTSQKNISKSAVSSSVFNFTNGGSTNSNHLPPVNENVLEKKVPVSEPLKIEVNGHSNKKVDSESDENVTDSDNVTERSDKKVIDLDKISNSAVKPGLKVSDINKPETKHKKSYPTLNFEQNNASEKSETALKNKVNKDNSVENGEMDNKLMFPKKLKPRVEESTQVFNFTKERRDVPDYISNDTSRTPQKPTLPQPGEGGIILIPGATMTSSFIDEDEEIMRSLEGPPSPCDVTFVNDNVLIDGRSCFIKETRKSKIQMKISFVETTDIFEYPSEDSLLLEIGSPALNSPSQGVGHSVPALSGSTLANYMPKTMEDFQPGITKSYQQPISSKKPDNSDVTGFNEDMLHEEINHPSIFSNSTNADILF